MKTFKHWLLTIATLLCSTSIQAYDFMVDSIYYNILSAADRTVEVVRGETDGSYCSGTIYYNKETILIPDKVTYNNIEFSVTRIGDGAFSYCEKLKKVKLPSTIKIIGSEAFGQCYNLKEVNFPSGLNSIEEYAFASCSKLQAKLPNDVSIHDYAFAGIKCIMLPSYPPSLNGTPFDINSLLLIKYELHDMGDGFAEMYGERMLDAESFYRYCGSYEYDDYYDNLMMYDSTFTEDDFSILFETGGQVIVDGITYVVKDFKPYIMEVVGGRNIKDANILSKVSYLNREFTVTSIRNEAFANVSTLENISIPNTIKSIGKNAFAGCTGIKNVTVASESPLNINDGCFDAMTQLFATLYVPTGCVSAYKNANVWKGFGTITESTVTHVSLTLKAGEGGSVTCENTSVTENTATVNVEKGSTTIHIKPQSYYVIKKVTVDGNDVTSLVVDGEITISINTDTEVEAIFEITSDDVNLMDGEDGYELSDSITCHKLNYTRTFNNTEWQALYIPFSMSYSDWSEDFDIAKINNVHQFDEDDDDVFDRTVLEVIKVKSGSLKPNHPYMIRAKSTGTKTVSIENATLMPAESNSIDCSSVERKYVFTGTYTGVDGEAMVDGMYYGMCNGELKYATNIDTSLKPFRWYMQILDRDGQVVNDIAEAKVIVRGEDDWGVTDIEDVKAESGKFVIYSIGGTLVRNVKADNINQATEGLSAGMYIINGKKHFIR